MPRILLVGDLHLKDKRLGDIASAWARVLSWAAKNDVDLVAQAGDVFDHVNVHGKDATVGTVYDAFLAPYMQAAIRTFLIPGNHDVGTGLHKDALAPMDGYPWITIARKPSVRDAIDGLAICAIPWINRASLAAKLMSASVTAREAMARVEKAISDLPGNLARLVADQKAQGKLILCLGHLEVTGSKVSGGLVQANGQFEFSPAALASIGADAYALAHLHVRQRVPGLPGPNDGYLGTLCQLSFGEEDNPTGCRVLEFEGRKIIADRWVENKVSPRFFTCGDVKELEKPATDERPAWRQGVDHVKVRAEQKPDSLPPGAIFEKVVRQERKQAPGRCVDCDTPIKELLAAWREASKCAIDLADLAAAAEGLASKAPKLQDAIGSLERINAISLRNVTCHPAVDLDLRALSGPCAICGPNGSGKTTLVEGFLLAPFGDSPSRPSLQSLASQGAKEPSSIGLDFVSGGKEFSVAREFRGSGKTLEHKALLRQGATAIAGPKVKDVQAACEGLIGDFRMVLAGVFSSQGEGGNLVDLPPSERKDLFAKLLGTHKFLALAELALRAAQGLAAQVEVQRNRISLLSSELESEPKDKEAVERLRRDIEALDKEVKDGQELLATAKERLAKADAARQERARALEMKKALEAKRERIRGEGRELKQTKERLAKLDPDAVNKELDAAREEKKKLDAIKDARDAVSRLALEAAKKASELDAKAERIKAGRAQAYSAHVREAGAEAMSITRSREAAKNEVNKALLASKAAAEAAKMRLEQAQKQAQALDDLPNATECKSCPLAKDSLRAKASLADLRRAVKRSAEQAEGHERFLAAHDEETKKLSDACKPQEPAAFQPEALKAVSELEREAELARAGIPAPDPAADKQLEALPAKAARIAELEGSLSEAAMMVAKGASLDAQIEEKRKHFKETEEAIKALVIPLEPDDSSTKKLVGELDQALSASQGRRNERGRELGAAEGLVKAHEARRAEMESLAKEIADKVKEASVMDALSRAFGRDGLPQMVVEGALPRFQEVMGDLLAEFDGRWSIQVASQKLTKAGTTQEVIDILVDSGDGPRDVSTYSGGEKKILKTVIRVAFSTLQAERTGKGLKVLVLDEATDHVDEDNAEIVIRMIGKLKSFNQVFVVSHNSRVLSSLPSRITCQPGEPPKLFVGGAACP